MSQTESNLTCFFHSSKITEELSIEFTEKKCNFTGFLISTIKNLTCLYMTEQICNRKKYHTIDFKSSISCPKFSQWHH